MKDFFEKRNRCKGTFIIKVENNSNDTWQGEVVWADENRSEKFRSALELFKLMNEAMESQLEQQDSNTEVRIG